MKALKIAQGMFALMLVGMCLFACRAEVSASAPVECRTVVRRRADVETCRTRCGDEGCRTRCAEQERFSRAHHCWVE
jgi:hypothetical protein